MLNVTIGLLLLVLPDSIICGIDKARSLQRMFQLPTAEWTVASDILISVTNVSAVAGSFIDDGKLFAQDGFESSQEEIISIPAPARPSTPVSDQMTRSSGNGGQKGAPDGQRNDALSARAEQTGRHGDALRIWRDVLGDYFPLTGLVTQAFRPA